MEIHENANVSELPSRSDQRDTRGERAVAVFHDPLSVQSVPDGENEEGGKSRAASTARKSAG